MATSRDRKQRQNQVLDSLQDRSNHRKGKRALEICLVDWYEMRYTPSYTEMTQFFDFQTVQ